MLSKSVEVNMVEIECPHCEKDIQLDDGAFGLFECPHCEEDLHGIKKAFLTMRIIPGSRTF